MSTSEPQANCWNKWPYIFGLPAYILAIEFALQISGRSQRLKETLAGVSVAIHSDVSGHGVGAALLSVSVMNALRSQSLPNTDFKDPEQVLASLNSTFPSEENNDMFFTIWYGVYNKSTRELTYASGGHPPALLFENTSSGDSGATLLRTANNAIGAMTDVTYEKSKHLVGEQTTLYIFSDGVYEVEKSDGSMWQFKEFADFMNKIKSAKQSRLDRLYQYAEYIRAQDNFEDDFTIVEVAFG